MQAIFTCNYSKTRVGEKRERNMSFTKHENTESWEISLEEHPSPSFLYLFSKG